MHARNRGLGITIQNRVRSTSGSRNKYSWTSNRRVEFEFPGTAFTKEDLKVFWSSSGERAPEELTSLVPEGVKYRFGCFLKGENCLLYISDVVVYPLFVDLFGLGSSYKTFNSNDF